MLPALYLRCLPSPRTGVSYAYRLNPGPFHAVWQALANYQQLEQRREMV